MCDKCPPEDVATPDNPASFSVVDDGTLATLTWSLLGEVTTLEITREELYEILSVAQGIWYKHEVMTRLKTAFESAGFKVANTK